MRPSPRLARRPHRGLWNFLAASDNDGRDRQRVLASVVGDSHGKMVSSSWLAVTERRVIDNTAPRGAGIPSLTLAPTDAIDGATSRTG